MAAPPYKESSLAVLLATSIHWFTYPNVDPVAIHITKSFGIRWYGLTYLIGALIVYLQLQSKRSRARTGMTVEQAQEFIIYALLGVFIGGRTLFVIANILTPESAGGQPFSYYLQHPIEFISIWHGGMAFHGGLAGALIGMWLFARRHRIALYPIFDETALWMPFAIALTRCANFINDELPGRLTDSPIGIQFPGFDGYRYPSQLFEAAGMLLIALPLLWLLHGWSKRAAGLIFWGFFAAYGVIRTIVEFYREPGIVFFGLTAAQYLTIAMFVAGVIGMIWVQRSSKASATV